MKITHTAAILFPHSWSVHLFRDDGAAFFIPLESREGAEKCARRLADFLDAEYQPSTPEFANKKGAVMSFEERLKEAQGCANTMTPMPQYQCHKKVWALRIRSIDTEPIPAFSRPTCRGSIAFGSACGHCERCVWERDNGPTQRTIITPEGHYGPFFVDAAYMQKHKPQAGGYFVQYEGGYQSFSPAKEFEDGYTLI